MRAIPVVALGVVFGSAGEAQAEANLSCGGDVSAGPYYDPCAEVEGWTELSVISSGAIPEDGVLVLQGSWSGAMPDLASISLSVTTDDDTVVAGAVEATDTKGVLVWRPDAAWPAGASITIDGMAVNAGSDGMCVPLNILLDGEVTIGGGGDPLVPVVVSGQEMVSQSPLISLASLACCEGVTPTQYEAGCGGGVQVDFDPDKCAPFLATGYMTLMLSGTPAATGATAGQVVYVLKPDGPPQQVSFWPDVFTLDGLQAPECVVIDAIDLRSGAVTAGEKVCFGEAIKDQLGQQVIDPSAQLSCELQVCEADLDQWDLEKCTPYGGSGDTPTSGPPEGSDETGATGEGSADGEGGGQDGEKGCACDASTGGPSGLLVLVGLAGLARRRRR